MKEKRTVEVTVCDFCKKSETFHKCLHCDKDACWECKRTEGVEYQHAVFYSGGNDGFYCTPCDIALSESRNDVRHEAFVAIRRLRDEYQGWNKNFDKRREVAEQQLASLRQENK